MERRIIAMTHAERTGPRIRGAQCTYAEASRGFHPDIPPEQRSDDIEGVTRALTLLLRDVFTEACENFSHEVRNYNPRAIRTQAHLLPKKILVEHSYGWIEDSEFSHLNDPWASKEGTMLTIPFPGGHWSSAFGALNAPIGEYGKAFAARMLDTTMLLRRMTESSVVLDFNALIMPEDRDRPSRSSPLLMNTLQLEPIETFAASIDSIMHAATLLTAERLPGYRHADAALEALFRDGLPRQVAMSFPYKLLATLNHTNRYIPGAVTVGNYGRLGLSTHFREIIHPMHEEYVEEIKRQNRQEMFAGLLGHGCPVGWREKREEKTGIGYMQDAFLYVYKALRQT